MVRKKLLLLLFSIAVSVGNICANSTAFHLTKKGGKHFQHNFSNMLCGLSQFLPRNKNEIGCTMLFLRCRNNKNEDIEHAKTSLKLLVYGLTDAGFANCMFKSGNGYIHVVPLKGTNYTDVCIAFKWTGISNIELIEF